MSLPESAVSAGYSTTNARYTALNLEKQPHVSARIAELQQTPETLTPAITTATLLLSRERVLTQLMLLAAEARGAKAWSPALRAWELIGRELGMFRDREEHFEWDGDPNKLSKGQRVKLIAGLREIVSSHRQKQGLNGGVLDAEQYGAAKVAESVPADDAGDHGAVEAGGQDPAGADHRLRGGGAIDPVGAGSGVRAEFGTGEAGGDATDPPGPTGDGSGW